MRRKGWLLIGVVVLGLIATRQIALEQQIVFGDISEAANSFRALNYTCHSDRLDGILDYGFMVSKEPADWADAAKLCKVGPMRPHWKNKVWVAPLSAGWPTRTVPEDAEMRIWGHVHVFGDREFLCELERGVRSQKHRIL
jgi:hypothetical protein